MSNNDVSYDWSGLEVLSFDECLEQLALASVGRIGFLTAEVPRFCQSILLLPDCPLSFEQVMDRS